MIEHSCNVAAISLLMLVHSQPMGASPAKSPRWFDSRCHVLQTSIYRELETVWNENNSAHLEFSTQINRGKYIHACKVTVWLYSAAEQESKTFFFAPTSLEIVPNTCMSCLYYELPWKSCNNNDFLYSHMFVLQCDIIENLWRHAQPCGFFAHAQCAIFNCNFEFDRSTSCFRYAPC